MTDNDVNTLIAKIIEAHGGAQYWHGLSALDVVLSASGFLFTAKHRPVLDRVRVRAYAHEPRFAFFDFPRTGQTAELIGDKEVRITDTGGNVIASRSAPRQAFRGLRRQLYWDDLDFVYFGGYATWNYLTTPFLFLHDGFQFTMLGPAAGYQNARFRLKVIFPDDIPTHCKEQIFSFDDQFHLLRLDYTAEIIGRWARAAHLCEVYRTFGGMKAPVRRRVLPLLMGNKPFPGPTLVAIDIHEIRPVAVTDHM